MLVTFLVFASIVIASLIAALLWLFPSRKNVSTIPGLEPRSDDNGNLEDIQEAGSFHEFLARLHDNYGKIASFWFGPKFCVSVASAEAFRDIQKLTDRPATLFEFLEPLIGKKSIQHATGPEAMVRHRRATDSLGPQSSLNTIPTFVSIAKELANAWEDLPAGEHIPLHDMMMSLSIRMISVTHFGSIFKNDNTFIKKFARLYEEVMEGMDNLLTGKMAKDENNKTYKLFVESLRSFKDYCREVIEAQKNARNEGDYLQAPLLDTLLDNSVDEEELLADVCAFFVGGFHTTGNLLTWLFYYLAMHPDIQERVYEEFDQISGDLTAESVKKLPYTHQVLDETLRMSITAPFAARVSNEREIRIGGHLVPAGTPIIEALGVSLRDKKHFENPDEFDPENFEPELARKRPALANSPFGFGKRRCPGYHFARFEALTVASVILRKFRLSTAFDDDIFIEPSFGFVTKPETEIWIKAEKRGG